MPFLYLCLRYYMSTLVDREERVKELESKLLERLYETFSAPCGWSRASRASRTSCSATPRPATTTMNARIAITWQQSLFSVVVSTITILGTALVRHRRRHATCMRGQLTVGELTVVIAYLGAVYGPLSAIAHTTGQLQGALAGAKRVRAMFALLPETDRRARTRSTRRRSRARSGSRTSASPIPTAPACCTTSPSRPGPARWWRSSA